MAIPVLPLTLVSSLERRLVTSVAEARSPFTGTSQIQDWGASWWEYQIEMAVTQGAKARRLSAFFTALGLAPGGAVLDLVRTDLEPDRHLGFVMEIPVALPVTRLPVSGGL